MSYTAKGRSQECASLLRQAALAQAGDLWTSGEGMKGTVSMMRRLGDRLLAGSMTVLLLGAPATVRAAAPTAEQALKLAPIQKDVDFDVPKDAEVKQCTIKGEKLGDASAWVVRGGSGQMLRK